jgi:hypothetical protein
LYSEYDYYLVREIDESEYGNIGEILESLQESIVRDNSSWLLRKMFRMGNVI